MKRTNEFGITGDQAEGITAAKEDGKEEKEGGEGDVKAIEEASKPIEEKKNEWKLILSVQSHYLHMAILIIVHVFPQTP